MLDGMHAPEHHDTIVIGGGQAGLSTGYHLRRLGVPFVILDGEERIGDQWRARWDSLRLFTPARFSSLDGMPFPGASWSFPPKDAMADYLESYAAHFELPVRSGVRVDGLARENDHFLVTAGKHRFTARNVIIAMAGYQKPRVPAFAARLRPDIVQLHSADYVNPSQLRDGPVLIVGAGNSGSEIAIELAPRHTVWMSGRDTGHLPFRIGGLPARLILGRLVLRGIFHRVLTTRTPIGRRVRPKVLRIGGPLIRVMPSDLRRAGVRRVPRTVGVDDGRPVLDDGRVLDVANVVWCTGFHDGLDWIDLPAFGGDEPPHQDGVVPTQPGLFFVGRHFLHALSSVMIHGVGRDAERIARIVAARNGGSAPLHAGNRSASPAHARVELQV